ncbi:MAG TPA: cytochrome P450 [Dehalococcoidia bacterium]|nr:cytochrome P450 [Dehalococcoidia bacterium]
MVTAEFNPFTPEAMANPYPMYREVLKYNPVSWNSVLEVWIYTRYEDVDTVLTHPKSSADRQNADNRLAQMARQMQENNMSPFNRAPTMLTTDPPEHTRLRRLVSKAFTPKAVEELRPRIQAIVDFLLDDIADQGEMDLVQALGYPLPVIVIAEMLGVPPEDRAKFKKWSDEIVATLGGPFTPQAVLDAAAQSINEMVAYLTEVIEDRRKNPRDDLISRLVAAEDEGNILSTEEIYTTTILLLVAGNETTTHLIDNGMFALLKNPEQLEMLRKEPDLIKPAVEELLRFTGPVQLTGRVMMEEVEIGGQVVKARQSALAVLGAANHDPGKWGENASELDITRNPTDHLAFGDGIHFCIGAPLARAEAQIAINSLLERFRKLELAGEDPEFGGTFIIRGVKSLPLRF